MSDVESGHWFRFEGGLFAPIPAPDWYSPAPRGEEWTDTIHRAGLVPIQSVGDPDGCFQCEVYSRSRDESWLFEFSDGSQIFHAEVRGFPDFLAMLGLVAPIATAGALDRLEWMLAETRDTLRPGTRWQRDWRDRP